MKNFDPPTAIARVDAIREIVTNKQCAKIDGTLVDGFTASAIIQLYDALSPGGQAHYRVMPAGKMGDVAWRVHARAETRK